MCATWPPTDLLLHLRLRVQGTFGSVYRSLFRGGVVAVKCVTPKSADEGTSFCREVEALAMVRWKGGQGGHESCRGREDEAAGVAHQGGCEGV